MNNMLVKDRPKLVQHYRILDRLPTRLRNHIYKFLIKIRIIRKYGHATLTIYRRDGTVEKTEGYNDLVDAGLKKIGDMLLGNTTENIIELNVGTNGDATTSSMTDLQSPAAPTERLTIPADGKFRSNKLLTFSVLVPSTKYTRPVIIKEMAIYFSPAGSGDMLARALPTQKTLETGDAARADYEIQL